MNSNKMAKIFRYNTNIQITFPKLGEIAEYKLNTNKTVYKEHKVEYIIRLSEK